MKTVPVTDALWSYFATRSTDADRLVSLSPNIVRRAQQQHTLMRVIHTVPSVSEEASGPSYSVPRLCESLINAGIDVQLATLASHPRTDLTFMRTFRTGLGPSRLGVSPTMKRWLGEAVKTQGINVVHNHSLWMMPNVYAGQACKGSECKLVVSPRGTLSNWALRRNAMQKRVFWWLMQERALRGASCFHATAEHEYADIRGRGFTQPVCIIPNGVDVPPLQRRAEGDRQRLLFLGRVHPIKGVAHLLRAWQPIERRFTSWDLDIVGPGQASYVDEMKALASELHLERVSFRGPLYGEAKLAALRNANLFVLPTLSENFGMAVAEALGAGVPAIVTRAAPWGSLEREGAGWWIEVGVDPLVGCLEKALQQLPHDLAEKGRLGREWMLRDYSWAKIGEEFKKVYRWILGDGELPSSVRLS